MSNLTGLKLGLHCLAHKITETNFYGCLQPFRHRLEPLRAWLMEKNWEYLDTQKWRHVLDTPELMDQIRTANHALQDQYDPCALIEFSLDFWQYRQVEDDDIFLNLYFVCRVYDPETCQMERVADNIGRFRIERSLYAYLYHLIDNLINPVLMP